MRFSTSAALAASLLALGACHTATVRGPQGRSMTVTTPTSMTIRRGDSAPLEVGIDRERFTGPVTASIFQLPRGVGSDRGSIQAQTTSATFILTAGTSADLVANQAVGVTLEDTTGLSVTQYFNLSVTN